MPLSKMLVAPLFIVFALTIASSSTTGLAANAPQQQIVPAMAITVYVKDMHCAGCAKKISSKLYTVKGVAQVKTDLQKHVAVIVPSQQQGPSLKLIWEAIEAVDFQPVKLIANQQTYTKKPVR